MKATRQQLLAEIESLKCELERYREIAAHCAANRILSKLPRRSDSENHNPILPSAFRK